MAAAAAERGVVLGRYVLYDEIAAGGMASVHLARLIGAVGFSRTVAIKRLHRHLAKDEAFHAMFLDEARLAARIRHPNVVPTLDVVAVDDELFLVMDYVHGESLSKLVRAVKAANGTIPIAVTSAILVASLHGLHAAHEAKTENGEPLGIVHRDVSPQNILVGSDGVVRVLDFGIAKAMGRLHTTRDGSVKGKAAYMAPEQLRGTRVDARTDVYAASVVLWELLSGQRLFAGDSPEATMNMVLERTAPPPSTSNGEVPPALDSLVLRGLSRDANKRFSSAREMAIALEGIVAPATPHAVAEWLERTCGDLLRARAHVVADIESQPAIADASEPAVPSSMRLVVDLTPAKDAEPGTATETAPRERARRRRTNALAYFAFCLAAAAIGVACWSFLTFRRAPLPAAAAEAALVATRPSASASASGTASPSVVEPVAAAPQPSKPPAARPAALSPVRRAPGRGTSPSRKCEQSFYVDANGIKSPRPECL